MRWTVHVRKHFGHTRMVAHEEDEHSQDETQSGRNGLRPPWAAMAATVTPWDSAKLFVLRRPRLHLDGYVLTESGPLPAGHPGVVHDSSWQDVGVTWIGFERELFTTGSVFDTQDLEGSAARTGDSFG